MRGVGLKILTVIVILSIVGVIFVSLSKQERMVTVITGNKEKKPLKIVLGKYQDSDCGMVIDDITFAGQVVAPDGRTWFFHDIGGMVHWIDDKPFKDKATMWVHTKDTNEWLIAQNAWYSLTDKTPMNYGFGAYKNKQEGFVTFKTMSIRMLRGETLNNPYTKKELLRLSR